MRKILVVNLTRFGDLLQTSPTIVGLREQHPGAEIVVLVERNFADVARGLPGVDRVWELDLDGLGRLPLGQTGDGLREAYRLVDDTVRALRAERFDLALNYSSSKMSAVLLKLVGAPDTRGWTMSADGHRLISHAWSRLFAASCLTRRQATFNLVDYYKRVAGVAAGPRQLFFDVPPDARRWAAEFLGEADGTPLIAFQLGASRDVRRWPAAHFTDVARTLHAAIGARFILCGGNGDRRVAEEIAGALGPLAIDACGRSSIAGLGALLERADVLVTGDTGPMHMAVAVGTPVVALFFGPALPFDTGPYAADHVCLHADVACAPCDHNVTCLEPFCRDTLAPAAVAEAVLARRAGDWQALAAAAERWPGIAWYRTTFDGEGLADVQPLGARPVGRTEALRRAYRRLWKAVLEGTAPAPGLPALPRDAAVLREVARLAADGARRALGVEALAHETPDVDALETAARGLEEVDARLFRLGAMQEAAALLVQVFRFEKENLEGDDVGTLARATQLVHAELATRAGLLAGLLEMEGRPQPSQGGDHASVC